MKIVLIIVVAALFGYVLMDVIAEDAYGKCSVEHSDDTCFEAIR